MPDDLPHRPPDRRDCGSWVAPDTGPDTGAEPDGDDCAAKVAHDPADPFYDLPW